MNIYSDTHFQDSKNRNDISLLEFFKKFYSLYKSLNELNGNKIIPKYRKGKIPMFRLSDGRLYKPKSQSHILLFDRNQIKNYKNHDMPFRLYGPWEIPTIGTPVDKPFLDLNISFNYEGFENTMEFKHAN